MQRIVRVGARSACGRAGEDGRVAGWMKGGEKRNEKGCAAGLLQGKARMQIQRASGSCVIDWLSRLLLRQARRPQDVARQDQIQAPVSYGRGMKVVEDFLSSDGFRCNARRQIRRASTETHRAASRFFNHNHGPYSSMGEAAISRAKDKAIRASS